MIIIVMNSSAMNKLMVPLAAALLIILGLSIYVFRNSQTYPSGITPGIGGGPPASIMEPSPTDNMLEEAPPTEKPFTPTTNTSPLY